MVALEVEVVQPVPLAVLLRRVKVPMVERVVLMTIHTGMVVVGGRAKRVLTM